LIRAWTFRPPAAPDLVERTGRLFFISRPAAEYREENLQDEAFGTYEDLYPRFETRMRPSIERFSLSDDRQFLKARGASEFQAIWTPLLFLKM
jgi:hypothetical protein